MREAIGAPLPPVEWPGYEATVQTARAVLGEAALAAAWAAGQRLTLEQAVAEALDETTTVSRPLDSAPDNVGSIHVE